MKHGHGNYMRGGHSVLYKHRNTVDIVLIYVFRYDNSHTHTYKHIYR